MNHRGAGTLIIALLIVCLLCGPAWAKLIDKIVATVDSEVITLSDLIRLRKIVERTQNSLLQIDVVLEQGTLKGVLDELVILTLVYRQAVKLNLTDYDEQQLQSDFEHFKDGFADQQQFEQFIYSNGWRTQEDLLEVFKRYIVAQNFVAKRVNLQVELRLNSYYEENKEDLYGGALLNQIEDRVRKDLYNEELKRWWEELTRNAQVKIMPTPL
ncbi:MAG: SurA N-terminal domain-containing protein [Candidatus Alcyoniella australis]|nr:SurA N-terminal domain-containing protein [Candidatus Alcyoniella australis]